MANEELVARLRSGALGWNAWRADTQQRQELDLIEADLRGADLSKANLSKVKLSKANLMFADLYAANCYGANLAGANLAEAKLHRANLMGAHLDLAILNDTDLSGAYLNEASLFGASLNRADLNCADLRRADLSEANLSEANLSEANLGKTILFKANLTRVNFYQVILLATVFADVDLATVDNLGTCVHFGTSLIDFRTLQRSGALPSAFLRGIGLPDKLIEYLPLLLNQPVRLYSCFISHSSKDQDFANRLHTDLRSNGVSCWIAHVDLLIGAKMWDAIDTAIRQRNKLLVILSKNSIDSPWVADEVNKAFAEERKRGTTVLFPVRIDDAVLETEEPWAVKLRDQRNIGDFRAWKEPEKYQEALRQLLRALEVPRVAPKP